MSLRWTEEELEDYRRRQGKQTEGTSSVTASPCHLPNSAEQSEAEAPAHRLSGAETRHRGKADRGGAYKATWRCPGACRSWRGCSTCRTEGAEALPRRGGSRPWA